EQGAQATARRVSASVSGMGRGRKRDSVSYCEEVQKTMWTDGPDAVPAAHMETCDVCRLEARRAGDVLAALAGMRARMAAVPTGLEPALLELASRARRGRAREVVTHPQFWRGAAAGAAPA